jgi:hypothetical protein
MSRFKSTTNNSWLAAAIAIAAFLAASQAIEDIWAICCGGGGRGIRQAVGGVFINTDGILSNAEQDATDALRHARMRAMQEIPADLNEPSELRKVSLRKLEDAIAEHQKAGKPGLPIEMRVLAGLQRIRYVFVYPEQNDIVLAGYGEGWKVDGKGAVVGVTTGRPVLLLDDLLVALRATRRNPQGSITCSIDPTPEGLNRLRDYVSGLKTIGDPDTTIRTIEQLLGPQMITVGGVPESSHFARVLVAADYRMKRLGMNFEEAPVTGLPSYIDMLPATGRGMQNMTPRWWMVPNYQPLLTDADGLAWELRGASVKTLTEDTFLGPNGAKAQTGKTSSVAQRWADLMTAKYDELSKREPIFGELRNCMDLAVAATLIAREKLATKAGYQFSRLLDASELPAEEYDVPKQTASKASTIKKGSNWIISASGGVEIDAWQILDNPEKSDTLAPKRNQAAAQPNTKRWWWN